jgi:hypothetical protein
VIGPALRRAVAVWAGAAIVGAVLFGPTGLPPHTVTLMMRESLGAVLVVGGTWLLLFVPIARVIVHADAARYLRSLPHSALRLLIVRIGALVGLQLPWIALWVAGEIAMRPPDEAAAGAGGPMIAVIAIAASTILAVLISAWRPRAIRRRNPRWTSSTSAFRAIYLAALARRAGDALVRGAGLSLLAGLAAGLFVRNNAFVGEQAAKMAGIISALALVPAYVGVLSPLLEAHRSGTWVAESAGVSPSTRAFALATSLVLVHGSCALLAMLGFAAVEPTLTVAAVAGTLLACAIASALGAAFVVLRAVEATMAATQMVSSSFGIAVGIAVALATMSTPIGPVAALLATGTMLVVRSERRVDAPVEVRA